MTGLFYGVTRALYQHIYDPCTDLLKYYAPPDNFSQLRIFTREVFKMENFRHGFFTNALFYGTYGLTFNTARFWM